MAKVANFSAHGLLANLPAPVQQHVPVVAPERPHSSTPTVSKHAPPYGTQERRNYIPRRLEDYADGGAFPEVRSACVCASPSVTRFEESSPVHAQLRSRNAVAFSSPLGSLTVALELHASKAAFYAALPLPPPPSPRVPSPLSAPFSDRAAS